MKKYSIPVCVLLLIISMCFCALGTNAVTLNEPVKLPMKEGVAPYPLSERDRALLLQYGMQQHNAPLFSYKAPEEAKYMEIRFYQLKDGAWSVCSEGVGIYQSDDYTLSGPFEGTIAVNRSTDKFYDSKFYYRISDDSGVYSSTADLSEIINDEWGGAGMNCLSKHQSITLGEPIPLAIWVYSKEGGFSMIDCAPQNMLPENAERYADVDLAIAMTVIFSDEYL